jgi:hypothetical protein
MSSSAKRNVPPIHVSIVSTNVETLDGLQTYLQGAGVSSHCTRAIHDLASVAPRVATAVVIFPDDFLESAAQTLIQELRRHRRQLLLLLVTKEIQRFRRFAELDREARLPIILPKPSFGWEILDPIRAHALDSRGSRLK